nr:MAG TPA: hypothetical protein [Caudoviricetes sp.]
MRASGANLLCRGSHPASLLYERKRFIWVKT